MTLTPNQLKELEEKELETTFLAQDYALYGLENPCRVCIVRPCCIEICEPKKDYLNKIEKRKSELISFIDSYFETLILDLTCARTFE